MADERNIGIFGGGFTSVILIILVILIFVPGIFTSFGFGGVGYKE